MIVHIQTCIFFFCGLNPKLQLLFVYLIPIFPAVLYHFNIPFLYYTAFFNIFSFTLPNCPSLSPTPLSFFPLILLFISDLNLGCPQRVAHAGHFGSYLLDKVDHPLIFDIVKTVSEGIRIPLFVKIRSVKFTVFCDLCVCFFCGFIY